MRMSRIAGIAVATLLTVTPSAFAQTQTKNNDMSATQTFTGCLMTEPAYRRAHSLGAGALGGAGLGDEYVLVDVSVSPAKGMTDGASSSDAVAVTGSTSATTCADQGAAYRMNGPAESKLKGLVGHEVEVQGHLKHADDVSADGSRPGEKLPAEVVIVSFREAPAPVPMSTPAMTAPAASAPMLPSNVAPPPAPPATPTVPSTPEPSTLPRTAGSTGYFALIGLMALSSGLALLILRRRAL